MSKTTVRYDLKSWGLKATPQRLAVIAAATGTEGYFTPQGLYESLKNKHTPVGLTTVYRTLEALERAELICRIESIGGERLYTRRSRTHHHHLVCEGCARVVEFGDCTLSELIGQLEGETGFTIRTHSLEFYGLCRACGLKAQGSQGGTREKT